jgi:hypothetical protein
MAQPSSGSQGKWETAESSHGSKLIAGQVLIRGLIVLSAWGTLIKRFLILDLWWFVSTVVHIQWWVIEITLIIKDSIRALKYLACGCFGLMMEWELGNTFKFSSKRAVPQTHW